MTCSPQRFLANNRNILRTATLTPSSVEPITDQVIETDQPRQGTAQAALAGTYTGTEEARYDIEILDNTVDTKLVSAPVFSGAGSGTITGIASTADPQEYTVELADAGIPALYAGTDLEGVHLRARQVGTAGNNIRLSIDQSPLTFADNFAGKKYSLLDDLPAGSGGETNGLEGPAFDWDTKVLGADDLIPSDAHRVAFGDDRGTVYLQYKQFADGVWSYHFVPSIKRAVPQGTPVMFVTGGRTVTITNGVGTIESHTGIVTLYDLLNSLKTTSALVDVDGVIANDRSPTGQASRELLTRTDAHAEPSTGTGSNAARGFAGVFVNSDADTELITARCFAITAGDHPLAHVGAELWNVTGSLSGDLGTVTTGSPFTSPDGKWGFTIPVRLPDGYGTQKGRISITARDNAPRAEGENDPPPICFNGALGPSATDQTIELTYTRRPSGNCKCDAMPFSNLYTTCLGIVGGDTSVAFRSATVARLVSLWDWYRGYVHDNTAVAAGVASEDTVIENTTSDTRFQPLRELVGNFQDALFVLDPLGASAYRDDGEVEWDAALADLQDDIDSFETPAGGGADALTNPQNATAAETLTAGDAVSLYRNPAGGWFVHKAAPNRGQYTDPLSGYMVNGDTGGILWGFVNAATSSGGTASVQLSAGYITTLSGLTPGAYYWPSLSTPGTWVTDPTDAIGNRQNVAGWPTQPLFVSDPQSSATLPLTVPMQALAQTATQMVVSVTLSPNIPGSGGGINLQSIPTERYMARLRLVLAKAGLDPLGKSDATVDQSGDGCWHDYGDAFYWTVVGPEGEYAPAFTNHPYWGSRRATDRDQYYSTHEFGFELNVKCPADLREGDRLTVTIGNAGWGATYQRDDTLKLPIIAAQSLYLAGGQAGSSVQKWFVSGSIAGPLPVYNFNPSVPAAYSGGGLSLTLVPGGVPFEKGDRFRFRIEGGHFQWRKTVAGVTGSWSSSTIIPSAPTALDAGLSISFTTGAAPSFVAGDLYSFRALQPWAVSNIADPTPYPWKWTGSSATLLIDAGSVVAVDGFALAFHTLPAGATVTVQGRNATSGAYDWTETLTVLPGAIALPFATARTARHLLLTLSSASAGRIGWAWAGSMFRTTWPADFVPRRSVKIARGSGDGLLQGGRYRGKAVSGDVIWGVGYLPEDDMDGLIDLFEWSKSNDDEPFLFLPQITRPEEALMAQITTDEIEYPERFGMQPNSDVTRLFQLQLPLQGVYQ